MANSFCYSPAITEKEYRGSTVGDLVERYYDNSYSLLVSQFVEDDKMDLEELKALIRAYRLGELAEKSGSLHFVK